MNFSFPNMASGDALYVFDNVNSQLVVPPQMGKPNLGQLASTPWDNLIELGGRACYDSLGLQKSRNSQLYHKHIHEVDHGSVQEHAYFTIEITPERVDADGLDVALAFMNRPGVHLQRLPDGAWHASTNVRHVAEWHRITEPYHGKLAQRLGNALSTVVQHFCPLAVPSDFIGSGAHDWVRVVPPSCPAEIWVSFWVKGSRGFSHELCRHRRSMSMRSTRFVDESEADWHPHPMFYGDDDLLALFSSVQSTAARAYDIVVRRLQDKLTAQGMDKLSARKQARGAARGLLGNALETQLIFTNNLDKIGWPHIFRKRMDNAADAEIRVIASKIFEQLSAKFPDHFVGWETEPAKDGAGLHLVKSPRMKGV